LDILICFGQWNRYGLSHLQMSVKEKEDEASDICDSASQTGSDIIYM
jgi:hypothetical protein